MHSLNSVFGQRIDISVTAVALVQVGPYVPQFDVSVEKRPTELTFKVL